MFTRISICRRARRREHTRAIFLTERCARARAARSLGARLPGASVTPPARAPARAGRGRPVRPPHTHARARAHGGTYMATQSPKGTRETPPRTTQESFSTTREHREPSYHPGSRSRLTTRVLRPASPEHFRTRSPGCGNAVDDWRRGFAAAPLIKVSERLCKRALHTISPAQRQAADFTGACRDITEPNDTIRF